MVISGLIPCAGKGLRWSGYTKELLPIGKFRFLIDETIHAMKKGGATKICVVSSPEKIAEHVKFFNRDEILNEWYTGLFYLIQRKQKDIWGAIWEFLPYATDLNYFAMPDTLYPDNVFFHNKPVPDLLFGCFKTNRADRFGVFHDNMIVNKSKGFGNKEMLAWGNFSFSKRVADFWLKSYTVDSYTVALNLAIEKFGYQHFIFDNYVDFASFEDYKEWIKQQ